MQGLTHLSAGFLIAATVAPGDIKGTFLHAVIASLVPDIDEPRSAVGRLTPVVSRTINFAAGHRRVTHTVLFACLVGLVSLYLTRTPRTSLVAFLACLSHIVLDGLTPSGVQPFAPLNQIRLHWIVRTGSFLDQAIGTVMCLLALTRVM